MPKKKTSADQAPATKNDEASQASTSEHAVADPAPAGEMDSASGAIIEPAIKEGVETSHPAVDSNPRAGTAAEQNARDMNDPLNRKPSDKKFVGEGLDPAPYGKAAK